MNHALILPILLPAVVGAVLVIAARYDRVLARVLSLASMVLMLALANLSRMGRWTNPHAINKTAMDVDPSASLPKEHA